MSSKENLINDDSTQDEHVVLKDEAENDAIKEDTNNDSQEAGIPETIPKSGQDPTMGKNSTETNPVEPDVGFLLKFVDTEFLEKKTRLENLEEVDCVASFRLDIDPISRLSVASPNMVWLSNRYDIRLVDIVRDKVIHASKSDQEIRDIKAIDDLSCLLMVNNSIARLSVLMIKFEVTNFVCPPSNGKSSARTLNAMTVSKSGEIYVSSTEIWKCLCFSKESLVIEKFDKEGNLLQHFKVQNKGKNQICNVYDIAVNENGDVCMAGEKSQIKGEFCVVVFDKDFHFRFSYDRNTSTQLHVPSVLATQGINNVIINTFKDRNKRRELNLTKKKRELSYIAVIGEDGLFRCNLPSDFREDGVVKYIDFDNENKAWMVTEDERVVVAIFQTLLKTPETTVASMK